MFFSCMSFGAHTSPFSFDQTNDLPNLSPRQKENRKSRNECNVPPVK